MGTEGQLYLCADVAIKDALTQGHVRAGKIRHPLTETTLRELPIELRQELTRYTTTDPRPQSSHRAWLCTSGLDAWEIRAALQEVRDERIAKERETAANEAKREEAALLAHQARVEDARCAPIEELMDYDWGVAGAKNWRPKPYFSKGTKHIEEAGRLEEVQAECDRRNEKERLEREAAARAKEERKQQETAERKAWICEHGSARLKRLLEEEIPHGAVYLDERLALDRPNWRWDKDVMGNSAVPRNAPEEALELLDAARAAVPTDERKDVKLVYWTISACESDHWDEEEKCPGYHEGWRGYAAKTEFLGKDIIFGGPDSKNEVTVEDEE